MSIYWVCSSWTWGFGPIWLENVVLSPKVLLPIASQVCQVSFLWSFVLALSVSVSCIGRCWLPSTMIRLSLDNRIHPSEMRINPSKTTCGCPCGEYNEKPKPNENRKQRNGHSRCPLTLWNAFDNVRLHNYTWWPLEWSDWERPQQRHQRPRPRYLFFWISETVNINWPGLQLGPSSCGLRSLPDLIESAIWCHQQLLDSTASSVCYISWLQTCVIQTDDVCDPDRWCMRSRQQTCVIQTDDACDPDSRCVWSRQ